MKTIVIAEAGVNHNGSLIMAKELIDVAANSGADFVKFQTFKAEKLVSTKAEKANYQKNNLGESSSQFDMLKNLELSEADHEELFRYSIAKNIHFLSTAFDEDSVDFLYKLGIRLFKVPSGELTNIPYLKKIGQLQGKVIVSTGMSNLSEIEIALNTLLESGTSLEDITILHCNTEYPTPFEDVNLKAMQTIACAFKVQVGYSDHTPGIIIPIAAVAMGAVIIEKHFTLDKFLPGPDHKASLDPKELKEMVSAIRNIELAMGNGIKKPSPSEIKNKAVARKSIHLSTSLKKGDKLKETDLIMKRPGDGIPSLFINQLIGMRTNTDLETDHKLSWKDLQFE